MHQLIYFVFLKIVLSTELCDRSHECTVSEKCDFFSGMDQICVENNPIRLRVETTDTTFTFNKNYTSLIGFQLIGDHLEKFEFIDSVEKLEILSVQGTNLTELSGNTFRNLPKLKKIYVNYSPVSIIQSGTFNGSKNLRVVDLQHNTIRKLCSDAFVQNAPLKHLWCSHNLIENVDFLKNLNNLKYLNLSSNRISNISSGVINSMSNLETLDVKYNNLTQLDFLKSLPNLRKLNLSFNKIYDIDNATFIENKRLEVLDLSYNSIKFIGEVLPVFNSTKIYLNNNLLTSIILKNKNFTLFLNDNPWNCSTLEKLFSENNMVKVGDPLKTNVANVNGVGCKIESKIESLWMNIIIVIGGIMVLVILLLIVSFFNCKKLKDKLKNGKNSEDPTRRFSSLDELGSTSHRIVENTYYISGDEL